ncbi:glycosyltransferase family 2 protein [Methanobacterium sp.]|uniref:glycosyltransferase family 2 protein n=1 Tax=Methanobacterium sp. TaxID=2164 RepID=UPI002ABC1269|nr:glycosyltransferase family 2 protein [Methanobacterium sp.]MDY9922946.1 glycosyltransferase family 2 protein [Methanobacterium sp.]
MKNLNISIIILNWNGWKDTIECLESIYQMDYPYFNVIVVDNKSEDDSIDKIRAFCEGKINVSSKYFRYDISTKPININYYNTKTNKLKKNSSFHDNLNLYLIKNSENSGFAEGNNIGIRFSIKFLNPKYTLLLNNDTVVDKKFLNEMIVIATQSNSGIIGPKILFYENEKIIQSLGTKINWFSGKVKHIGYRSEDQEHVQIPQDLDGISGCAMLIKKEVFDEIDLFDPQYYLYYEDNDLCIRAKRKGFVIETSQNSKVWHKDSSSSQNNGIREYYSSRNHFLFMKIYANQLQYSCFLIYYFCFKFWLDLLIIIIHHKNPQMVTPYIKGVSKGLLIKHR